TGGRDLTLLHGQRGCQCDNHRSLSETMAAIGSTLASNSSRRPVWFPFASGLIVIALRERRASSAIHVARSCGRLPDGRQRPWLRHIKEMSQMSVPAKRRQNPSFALSVLPTCIVHCNSAGKIS